MRGSLQLPAHEPSAAPDVRASLPDSARLRYVDARAEEPPGHHGSANWPAARHTLDADGEGRYQPPSATAPPHAQPPPQVLPAPAPPSGAGRATEQELEVLDYLMQKVKLARGSGADGPMNMANPPGLDAKERQVFKHLMGKMRADDPGGAHDAPSAPASWHAPPPATATHAERHHRAEGRGAAPSDSPRRPANRPPPFATGAGFGGGAQDPASITGSRRQPPPPQGREALPYATDESLSQAIANTKDLEGRLMELQREKNQLDAEYSKMPANAGKTIAQRQRKVVVEQRLEAIAREISSCRLGLKKLGA